MMRDMTSWTPGWDAFPAPLLDFWTERHLCTLNSVRPDGRPHAVPVGVVLDHDERCAWVITSRESRKARTIAAGPATGVPVAACQVDGQRKRLNVGSPVPLYVSRIDPETHTVTVAPKEHPALVRHEVLAEDPNFIALDLPADKRLPAMTVTAKIRYNSADQPAVLTVEPRGDAPLLRVRFQEPVRAATPGQSLVCYQGEEVIGGGIIAG